MAESDSWSPGLPGPQKPVAVSVFGGLRIWRAEHEIDPGPRRNRLVLAELLAAGGSVVSVSDLVDAMWSFHPPGSAVNQVHRLVGQLRRTLEPGLSPHSNGRYVVAADGGYRLAVDLLDSDLFRFRKLATDADILLKTGQADSASELYVTALELARGPLFGSLDAETATRPEFLAIEQERVAVAIVAAELASTGGGSSAATTAAVVRVAASAPLNEPLHARLMMLLAANGRSADALVVFDQIRRRLADELGVDPSSELRDAHQALLMLDQSADEPPTLHVDPVVRPAQLPPALPGFVCRPEAQAALDESMADAADSVGIAVIAGMGGIGKTALAAHWAHRVRHQFPDGQLYVDLRGFDPSARAVTAETALNMLLEGLGQSLAELSGVNREGRVARYRSLMADRRMIIMLDNVIDAEQVRPLIPSAPGCMVLITSRIVLTSLIARDGARFIPIGRLSPSAALEILRRRVGLARLNREPPAVDTILDHCDGLPLALTMVAARIATDPALTIAAVAERLTVTGHALDSISLGAGRDDLRTVFSWSYEALNSGTARLFRLLAVHPGPEISLPSLASLSGLTMEAARKEAVQLLAAHMLEQPKAERYLLHDLLRTYADDLLGGSGERDEASRRLVQHYTTATRAAYNVYNRPPIAPLPPSIEGLVVEKFDSVPDAVEWYIRERAVLAEVINVAIQYDCKREVLLLVLDQRPMNQSVEPVSASLDQTLRALEFAIHVNEPGLEAELERDAGLRSWQSAGTASAHYARALQLFEQLGDPAGEANTYRNMCQAAFYAGNADKSLEFARLSMSAAERSGRVDILGATMSSLTAALLEKEQWPEVIRVVDDALQVMSGFEIYYLHNVFLLNRAIALLRLGDAKGALLSATEGLVFQDKYVGMRDAAYGLIAVQACAAFRSGQVDRARAACHRFITMLDESNGGEDEQYLRSVDADKNRSMVAEVQAALCSSCPDRASDRCGALTSFNA